MGNDGARDRIEHGPMALWATKAQLEAHARLIWENLAVNLGANKKQWHAHFAKHMCDVLRGSSTSGGSAGGDRLFKWQVHYGIVSNPVTTSLFVGLLDTTLTATSRAGTPVVH